MKADVIFLIFGAAYSVTTVLYLGAVYSKLLATIA